MRERPIIFSAPMVRAILGGTKTQTRRIVKPKPSNPLVGGAAFHPETDICTAAWVWLSGYDGSIVEMFKRDCPYGIKGDRLWVRESGWERPERTGRMMRSGADTWAPYYYDADGIDEYERDQLLAFGFKRRPSIFMPRWASRITLEITGVRVERLQDVSDADAIAEGVDRFPGCRIDDDTAAFNRIGPVDNDSFPIARYAVLWESINGPESWAANPFVWVVEFKRHV